jgi:hypothetical protein
MITAIYNLPEVVNSIWRNVVKGNGGKSGVCEHSIPD